MGASCVFLLNPPPVPRLSGVCATDDSRISHHIHKTIEATCKVAGAHPGWRCGWALWQSPPRLYRCTCVYTAQRVTSEKELPAAVFTLFGPGRRTGAGSLGEEFCRFGLAVSGLDAVDAFCAVDARTISSESLRCSAISTMMAACCSWIARIESPCC